MAAPYDVPRPDELLAQQGDAAGAAGGGFASWGLPAAFLGTAIGGTVFSALEQRKARKAMKARQERILAAIDTGASEAKGALAAAAGTNQANLLQSQINRGVTNTSVRPGEAAGVALDAGSRMAAVEQDRARQRAEAISAFGDAPAAGGSMALGGAGHALGVLLAARGARGGGGDTSDATGGSGVAQVAARTPAIDQVGGDPGLSSGSFSSSFSVPGSGGQAPIAGVSMPQGVQDAASQQRRGVVNLAMQARARRRSPRAGSIGASVYA